MICFNEIKNKVAVVSCGHAKFCEKCVTTIKDKKCPVCRGNINSVMKIFF